MTAIVCFVIAAALALVAAVHYHYTTTLPLAVAFTAVGLLFAVLPAGVWGRHQ